MFNYCLIQIKQSKEHINPLTKGRSNKPHARVTTELIWRLLISKTEGVYWSRAPSWPFAKIKRATTSDWRLKIKPQRRRYLNGGCARGDRRCNGKIIHIKRLQTTIGWLLEYIRTFVRGQAVKDHASINHQVGGNHSHGKRYKKNLQESRDPLLQRRFENISNYSWSIDIIHIITCWRGFLWSLWGRSRADFIVELSQPLIKGLQRCFE